MHSPSRYNPQTVVNSDLIAAMVRNALLSEIIEAKSDRASPSAAKRPFAVVEKTAALLLMLAALWLTGRMLGLN